MRGERKGRGEILQDERGEVGEGRDITGGGERHYKMRKEGGVLEGGGRE